MAGKAKSIYLTVCPKNKPFSVLKKMFFNAKDYNEFVKNEEFKLNYPKDQYDIIKEIY
jgi:hypothetical protein